MTNAELLLQMTEIARQIAETAAGYKVYAESLGFSPGLAEQMAGMYWHMLMNAWQEGTYSDTD